MNTPPPSAPSRSTFLSPHHVLHALRPSQWTKNLVVLAAFFFAFGDRSRIRPLGWPDLVTAVCATLLFCMVSSGIYLLNDILDIDADRNHPTKRFRAVAAGHVSIVHAWILSILLLVTGTGLSWMLSAPLAGTVVAYVLIQVIYSLWLKHVALADILLIAVGFVLRAIAGALAYTDVQISPWLLLCTFLLALFLALCKRRQEKIAIENGSCEQRPSLESYDERLLDQLIAISSASMIVCYAIYTLWPQTVEKFGTSALGFTIPFVIFGVFRYLDLVYRHRRGSRPERILLTDGPILINIGLYGLTLAIVFLLHL